ncbi:hypothetical protein CPC08DRAFT_611268, partial [Agrocybe pediades]
MLMKAEKYGLKLTTIMPSVNLLREMPIWHHKGLHSEHPILNNSVWADCQRNVHGIRTVGDMLTYVGRVFPGNHRNIRYCPCDLCRQARELGCRNPAKCPQAGVRMLDSLVERWDPRRQQAMQG